MYLKENSQSAFKRSLPYIPWVIVILSLFPTFNSLSYIKSIYPAITFSLLSVALLSLIPRYISLMKQGRGKFLISIATITADIIWAAFNIYLAVDLLCYYAKDRGWDKGKELLLPVLLISFVLLLIRVITESPALSKGAKNPGLLILRTLWWPLSVIAMTVFTIPLIKEFASPKTCVYLNTNNRYIVYPTTLNTILVVLFACLPIISINFVQRAFIHLIG